MVVGGAGEIVQGLAQLLVLQTLRIHLLLVAGQSRFRTLHFAGIVGQCLVHACQTLLIGINLRAQLCSLLAVTLACRLQTGQLLLHRPKGDSQIRYGCLLRLTRSPQLVQFFTIVFQGRLHRLQRLGVLAAVEIDFYRTCQILCHSDID